MRLVLAISFLLLSGMPVFSQDSVTVKTDKIDGIIYTNFADWKPLVQATEFWTPTKEEVLKAEEKIEEYLRSDPARYAELWRKLPNYKRQYVGIIVNGHKRIFCNFFCSKTFFPSEYLSVPLVVDDGGECFFRIEYDLGDKKCYNFNANGNA